VKDIARECFAGLGASTREAVIQCFASGLGGSSDRSLRAQLASLREMLRERLPGCGPPGTTRQCVYVDAIHALDERSFWIRGWFFDGESPATRLRVVSPEGIYVELLPQAFRHPREDLAELFGVAPDDERVRRGAFSAFFELAAPSVFDDGWIVELHSASADPVESAVPPVSRRCAEEAGIKGLAQPGAGTCFEDHVLSAMDRLRKGRDPVFSGEAGTEYGATPAAPVTSVLIPLTGGANFLEQQLALFSHDPQMRETDLVYVVSSDAVDPARLCRLYPVPFRVAVLNQEASLAAAMNVAASIARGRWLVLLGATVFPHRAGWLGEMTRFCETTPNVGALGAWLWGEDDSPPPDAARRVPAVSGHCLMVARERFQSVGGLGRHHLTSDFSVADLCLRLSAGGLENWYAPGAKLYHLNAIAKTERETAGARRYDAWLFQRTWGTMLKA
jgi:O-antigen biosynthesis protein